MGRQAGLRQRKAEACGALLDDAGDVLLDVTAQAGPAFLARLSVTR
jgi:hypothetical protein